MRDEPWVLRDPGALLDEIDQRGLLRTRTTVLALVEHPSTDQLLCDALTLCDGPPPREVEDRATMVRCAARNLYGDRPDARPPRHAFVTIVARPGRVVFRDDDTAWLSGHLFANHLLPVFHGDLILVTEHGWRSCDKRVAGRLPALRLGAGLAEASSSPGR